ncbi:methyltransferase domain protein [Lyngbya aestuarii BL J]|uniref:Methyltransferase domain protein n=1 Tax=Lyngbya aestuarii BL J TaxID=1348334 RepID=U7QM84_9CYAN|nr:class I SAM-dependent methyltransferase [Lyngbya aestuarii]ERT08230.1 methyltransferase domain protein [Lyngbya aestuarii BL J]
MTTAIEQELEEVKVKWQQTQSELAQTKSELHDVREELTRSQSQLDEVLGELEQTHWELHQLKEKGEQKQSESQVKQELQETKSKLRETEQLLEQSQSQLSQTMEVLEQYKSQTEQMMEMLEESQEKLQQQKELQQVKAQLAQQQSEPALEVQKKLKETEAQFRREPEQLLEQSDEQNRLFKIQNAVVKPIKIQGGKWFGGVVFPEHMPEIFRHRRGGSLDQEIVYMDQLMQVGQHNNIDNNSLDESQINSLRTHRGTYIYGGPFHPHFGHSLTESIHRLWAFKTSIHDGIVFAVSLRPNLNRTNYTPPQWFIQTLEILEIPLAKCIWVTNDCIFENLIIPEPGSELSLGLKKWYPFYLEKQQERILALTESRRKDKPEKLFLGRNHIPFNGNLAGEKYFETLLVDEGYISLKPENYDLLEQLAYIISAKKIIFSEGSSIYITELINDLDAEIACIPRRPSNKPFYPHISSKTRNYIVAGNVADILPLGNWEKQGIRSIPICKHPSPIVESLRKHDFALLKNWDENKFFSDEKRDFMTYVDAVYNFLPNQNSVHRAGVVEKYLQIRGLTVENSTSQASESMPIRSRSDRLNKLASINQSCRYLEIGVSKGITFNAIKIDNKVAVDPKFGFNTGQYATDKVVFLEVSSDEFFRSYAKELKSFDLIYLDGLHTFEQTFRDFCASLAWGHSKTIWLIDDTCPGSYAQAQPSVKRCREVQKFSGEKDNSWMGDVFKVVAAIHDFFPQYSFATFPDHGQTVVWNHPRADFQPKWNNLKIISQLQYADFVELQNTLFKRESYENIFARIRHDLGLS